MTNNEEQFYKEIGAYIQGDDQEVSENEYLIIQKVNEETHPIAKKHFEEPVADMITTAYTIGFITGVENTLDSIHENFGGGDE